MYCISITINRRNNDFTFEHKLDEMLKLFFDSGTQPIQLSKIPQTPDKNNLLSILRHRKFIEPMKKKDYNNGQSVEFYDLQYISDAGINFYFTSSFVLEAKKKRLDDLRWKREYKKILTDNIIAVLALLLSIAALAVAILKK